MAAAIRILYVDDEADLLDIGKLFLEESGDFIVTTVLNADEGIQLLEQEQFDAIISDYQMPGMDGIQFLVEVRKRFGPTPFILFTGRGREEIVIQAINSGADFYLQKGGEPGAQFAELSHKIKSAASRKMAEDSLVESELRYRSLFENLLEGFAYCRMLYDTENKPLDFIYINVNPAFHRIAGTTAVIGKPVTEVFPGIKEAFPELFEIYGRVALNSVPESFDLDFVPSKKWLHISVYSPAKEYFVAIFEDITDRVLAQSETKKSHEELVAAYEELTATDDELRHALNALAENEKLYRTLFHEMLNGFAVHEIICDENGTPKDYRFIDVNPAFERMTGLHREDLIGKTVLEMMPNTEPIWIERYGRVALTGTPDHFESYSRELNRFYEVTVYQNASHQFTTVISDVTDRKRAEDYIRKSEQQFRALSENSQDYIMRYDKEHRHTYANPACLRVSGMTAEQFLGKTHSELGFPPDLCALWESAIDRVFATGMPYGETFTWTGVNGEVVLDWQLFPEKDERGCVISVLGVSRDITERKVAEERLIETTKYLNNLFDYANAPIIVWDPNFVITRFNHAFEDLTLISEQEIIGQRLDVLFPTESKDTSLLQITKTLEGVRWETVEIPILVKDGSVRTVLWNSANILDSDGRVISTIAQGVDITGRKQAETALNESYSTFRTVMDSLDALVYVADMNTFEILFVNQYGRKIFGDLSGKICWQSLQTNQNAPCPFCTNKKLLDSEGNPAGILIWEFKNTINGHWYECHDNAIRWTDRRIVRIEIATDITARKQVDEVLRGSEERFRGLVDTINSGVAIYEVRNDGTSGKDYIIKDFNKTALEIEGKTKDEVLGRSLFDLRPAIDEYGLIPIFKKVWETGVPVYFPQKVYIDEKYSNWYENRVFRLQSGEIVAVYDDVTERKVAEETLRNREEYYRTILQTTKDGFWIVDAHSGRFMDVNETYCAMSGYAKAEILKMGINDIDSIEDPVKTQERIQRILTNGSELFETRHRRKDGSLFDVEISVTYFPAEGGKFICFCRDITERKQAEETLRESKERYNSLFTNNYSISLLIDPETGMIVDANAAACKYYGYSPEKVREMGIYEINKMNKEKVLRNLKEAKKKKERHFFSTHFLADGKQRNVEIYSGPILVNGKLLFYSIIHDVTDRVKAEEELKNSRRFIDHTLTTTPALIYIYDVVEGRNVYTNRGIFEALGYTPEEISAMGQDLFPMILHPADAGPVGQHHARFSTLPDSTVTEIEYRMKHADGSWRWLHSRDVVFQRTQDGVVKQILGSSIDITERKQAEEALKKSEEKYRMLIEQTDEGVWIVGSDYKTTFVNNRLAAMFGYLPQEMIGKKVQEFMPAEDMEVHSKRVRERLEGKGDRFEQKFLRKDGSVFWVIASVTPLLAEDTRFDGAFAMLTDITERKRAEEALRESEERYRAVADFTYDWEYWMALDGKFVYVSPSCERITGYRPEEFILNPNLLVTITHADDRDKIIEHLAVGQKLNTEHGVLEFRIITRNGEERWIGHECQPVFNTNGGYLGRRGSNRDITERKRAEENLIATIKRTRNQHDVLGTISFSPFLFSGDVQGLSAIITEVSSGVLGVERASVWLFNNNEDELRCIDLYEVLYDRHSYDGVLKRHEYVNEFDALSTAKYIDAHDPLTDPRTAGYIEDYLKPNHITSMLDAVIRVSGQNLGVLCFEHVNRPHHWESDEISFACQLADQIAITLLNRDRKLAEEALLESEERYRNVVEDQTEFICRFLPDGTHIFVNDAYCRYFDKKREEIIGQRFKPLLHTEDREMVTRHLASLTPEHPVEDIDQRIIMPDDSLKWQRWSDRAIFDPNGRVIEYQSVGRDITEQKELEKEMEYHEQELRKYSTSLTVANKKLNLLSSITRHDITNQLTVLVGYLRILQKNQPDPSFNDYFQKIATASQRISSMIQFTKEYENIGVNAPIWQDCRTLIDTTAKQVQLGTFTVKNDLPSGAEVFADPLISKVFYNLMDNAVRYGNKITTIRFSVEESGNDPVIVCEDDGDGVVAEEKERIFERGFGKNTGLGLALVREILSITGITIRETGEPGKGARFEMTLPKGAWRMKGKDA